MRFDAAQLKRMSQALVDLGDISDRNQVHLSDSYGRPLLEVDGEMVPIGRVAGDDGSCTYVVEVDPA